MAPTIPEVGSLTWVPMVGCDPRFEVGVRYPTAKEASRFSLAFTRLSQEEALRLARLAQSGPVPEDYESPEHTEALFAWGQSVLEHMVACLRETGDPSPVADPRSKEAERTRALEILGRLTLGEQVLQAIKILHEVGRLPESFRPPPQSGGDSEGERRA